jgi:hypothetical protein
MRIPIVLAAFALAACAGDSPPATGRCTGALFQPCSEEHDCDSGICQNFMGEGFQVCTKLCDDATEPCPEGSECNAMGICKPAEPDGCTP